MIITKAEYSDIGNRIENEDSMRCEIVSDNFCYAIVADGLGGHGGGRAASQLAVKNLSKCAACTALPTPEEIFSWMQTTNNDIFNARQTQNNMKTTAVFLSVFNNQAIWAHIGDSRLYHFHNGNPVDYTLDHSVPQLLVTAGELTRDQIPFSPDRNKVVKVLGTDVLDPNIHAPVVLAPGIHAFLLCTDGFWEYLREDEIWLDLQKSASPEEWIMYLRCRGECRKKGDADNNSAVAVFCMIN